MNRQQILKDELSKINIHYTNGSFIYAKSSENLPHSYEGYLANKENYPNVDAYLSFELNSMLPQIEEIEQGGYTNHLSQKPNTPNISEKIILQSGELIVNDDDVPDNLKKAGYTLDRGNVLLKIIKNDKGYELANYDGSRHVSTLLGGHDSKSRKIIMNDVVICLDNNLEKEIRKLNNDQQKEELKKIYELAKNSGTIQSSLERMSTFVHEATHANNNINEIQENNKHIRKHGTNINKSLTEVGFRNRNDEISAVFNALRYEIKHYNQNNKPQDTSQYSAYFKAFLKECEKLPEQERDVYLNSPLELLTFVDEAWSINQGFLYASDPHSQILEQMEYQSKYYCAFDLQSDSDAYQKTLSNYFTMNTEGEKIDLSSYIASSNFRPEYGYIMAQGAILTNHVNNRINKLKSAGITNETRKKMIELYEIENNKNKISQNIFSKDFSR